MKGQLTLGCFKGVTEKVREERKEEEENKAECGEWRSEKPMKIVSWNLNGIHSTVNNESLANMFRELKPDMLLLQETKTDEEKLPAFRKQIPKGYAQFWNCSQERKGYSGTALFSKLQPLEVTYGIGIPKHDREGRVITAEFPEFLIVNVYVPNSMENFKRLPYRIHEWDHDFFAYCGNLEKLKQKPLILAGDLNCAHQEIDVWTLRNQQKVQGFHPQERESFDRLFYHYGFIDSFRHIYPDRQTFSFFSQMKLGSKQANKGWRLDYFLVTKKALAYVVDSKIHKTFDGSDHCPVELKYAVGEHRDTILKKLEELLKRMKEKGEQMGQPETIPAKLKIRMPNSDKKYDVKEKIKEKKKEEKRIEKETGRSPKKSTSGFDVMKGKCA